MKGWMQSPLKGFQRFFYFAFAIPLLSLLCKLMFGLQIKGRESLSLAGGAVLVCNHVHYLDSAMVAVAARGRHVTFATLDQNFRLPVAGWLLKQFGCLPVGATLKGTKQFLEQAERLLAQGNLVGIFPEGNLEEYHSSLQEFQRGAFVLAAKAEVPVIPLAILQRPVKWYRKLFHRKPFLTLQVGKPIYAPEGWKPREQALYLQEEAYRRMACALGIEPEKSLLTIEL